MRKKIALSMLLAVMAIFVANSQVIGNWEKLGERKVQFKSEKDVIKCSSKKSYTKFKIRVNDAPIEFDQVVVNFANGDSQDVKLRSQIPSGGESRVIDLVGNKRIIKDITFKYRSKKGHKGGKATVEVWGRR
ncbi:MAG: hypothetical protein ACRC6R_00740 [Bacteroidales bacterium]